MINKYIFNYGYVSLLNEEVDKTYKVNNHKVSADIFYKLYRKIRKDYKRSTFYKVLLENYKTNNTTYNEFTNFERS